jgi:hypothetical protein
LTAFPDFHKKHGAGENCVAAPKDVIEQYRSRLPNSLLELWQQSGWCSYAKGLIWIVNPSAFAETLSEWVEASDNALVFARTAFADMFLWRNHRVEFLSTQYAWFAELTDDVSRLFESLLCEDRVLNNLLIRNFTVKATKKLGPLAPDECYGFEPVLALGGSGKIDTVQKVKLVEYLSMLSQVAG